MVQIYTPDEVLSEGLVVAGFDHARQKRVQRKTNVERFVDYFGVAPAVYAEIWEDLQTTSIVFRASNGALVPARMDTTMASVTLQNFLLALHFIKAYPTEKQRAGKSGRCERFMRKWGWYFLERIAALKKKKVKSLWVRDHRLDRLFTHTVSLLSDHLAQPVEHNIHHQCGWGTLPVP